MGAEYVVFGRGLRADVGAESPGGVFGQSLRAESSGRRGSGVRPLEAADHSEEYVHWKRRITLRSGARPLEAADHSEESGVRPLEAADHSEEAGCSRCGSQLAAPAVTDGRSLRADVGAEYVHWKRRITVRRLAASAVDVLPLWISAGCSRCGGAQ